MKIQAAFRLFALSGVLACAETRALEAPPADSQTNLIRRAGAGEATAQASLASLYWYNGHFGGTRKPKDADEFKKCAFWATKAARQNEMGAQCLLGDLYLDGLGVVKDQNLARQWYFHSASNGNSVACAKMGMLYSGVGSSETNLVESYAWFLLATNNPNLRGEVDQNLHRIGSALDADRIKVATARAADLLAMFRQHGARNIHR